MKAAIWEKASTKKLNTAGCIAALTSEDALKSVPNLLSIVF